MFVLRIHFWQPAKRLTGRDENLPKEGEDHLALLHGEQELGIDINNASIYSSSLIIHALKTGQEGKV